MESINDKRRKLTDEQKEKVRRLYSTGNYSLRILGRMFNVSHSAILLVVSDKYYENQREYKKENWKNKASKESVRYDKSINTSK